MADATQPRSDFTEVLSNLAQQMKDAVNRLATLEVHTIVTNFEVTVTTPNNQPLKIVIKAPGSGDAVTNGAYTAINALTGDIRTLWSSNLDPVANAGLINAHNANVALSREIFAKNLKTIGDLIQEFT